MATLIRVLAIGLVCVGIFGYLPVQAGGLAQDCSGALPTRLAVGGVARIPPGLNVRLRFEPSQSAKTRALFGALSQFIIFGGPTCAEGGLWWQVRTTDGKQEGWMLESEGDTYLLAPPNTPVPTQTPRPTNTPRPSNTPRPTSTFTPTPNRTATLVARTNNAVANTSTASARLTATRLFSTQVHFTATARRTQLIATNTAQALATQKAATSTVAARQTQAQVARTQIAAATATAVFQEQYRPASYAGITGGTLNGQKVRVRGYIVNVANGFVYVETSPGRVLTISLAPGITAEGLRMYAATDPKSTVATDTAKVAYSFFGVAQNGEPHLKDAYWAK